MTKQCRRSLSTIWTELRSIKRLSQMVGPSPTHVIGIRIGLYRSGRMDQRFSKNIVERSRSYSRRDFVD